MSDPLHASAGGETSHCPRCGEALPSVRFAGDDDAPPRSGSRALIWVICIVGGALMAFFAAGTISTWLLVRMLEADVRSAKQVRVVVDLASLHSALDAYAMQNDGSYPESLEVLVAADSSGVTFLDADQLPVDPWGATYLYDPPGRSAEPRVYSLGADGEPGGHGDDEDLDLATLRDRY